MSSLDWVKEIKFDDLLDNDTKLIADNCGMPVLLSLLEHLSKMTLYISTTPLTEAKRRYIYKFYDGNNAKKLAHLLDVSERFVFQTVSTTDDTDTRQRKLFEKNGGDDE